MEQPGKKRGKNRLDCFLPRYARARSDVLFRDFKLLIANLADTDKS